MRRILPNWSKPCLWGVGLNAAFMRSSCLSDPPPSSFAASAHTRCRRLPLHCMETNLLFLSLGIPCTPPRPFEVVGRPYLRKRAGFFFLLFKLCVFYIPGGAAAVVFMTPPTRQRIKCLEGAHVGGRRRRGCNYRKSLGSACLCAEALTAVDVSCNS